MQHKISFNSRLALCNQLDNCINHDKHVKHKKGHFDALSEPEEMRERPELSPGPTLPDCWLFLRRRPRNLTLICSHL